MSEAAKTGQKPIETVDNIPTTLPVLSLRDVVVFPYMIYPVMVGPWMEQNTIKMMTSPY